VKKRPGLDEFIEEMSQIFEIIIFTSSLEEVREKNNSLFQSLKKKFEFFFSIQI